MANEDLKDMIKNAPLWKNRYKAGYNDGLANGVFWGITVALVVSILGMVVHYGSGS